MTLPATGSFLPSPEEVSDLVMIALAQKRRSGLSEMLRFVAESVHAAGCILWQEKPDVLQLFVLADWFKGKERSSIHNLSLLRSVTGQAIQNHSVMQVDDVVKDPRVDRRDPFLQKAGIRCFCSIPLTFLAGKRGALNVYRTENEPFHTHELKKLECLARLLPRLYETIIDQVSYQLVGKVNQILNAANGGIGSRATVEAFRGTARNLCRSTAETFDAMEVSLFLENSLATPGVYRLAATTWPARRGFAKPAYTASEEQGLTGWVLARQKSLRIFDLAHFERERGRLRSVYPGLTWGDSLKIEASTRKFLGIQPGQNLQPLSFMAVPVLASGKILGVLRCCTATRSPYYFGEQELKLLELVADQIGQAWSDLLHRREIEEEINTWESLADSMRDLNLFVEKQVAEGDSSETQIFHRALGATNSVIPGAEISDVRLLNEEKRELYFEATHGEAWSEGNPTQIAARRDRRFPIDGDPPPSGGAHVVRTGEIYLISDTDNPTYHYSETFSNTRRMIIVPISVAGTIFGVLDIRSTGDRDFPPYAIRIAEIIGQQLGLYHYLLKTFADLQNFQQNQVQTFEDFAHQLKSPIHQVHARIQNCVRLANHPACSVETLRPHLLAVRGLAAKAIQVSRTLGLFADLAENKKLRPDSARLLDDPLLKILIEAAIDQEITLDPERRLRYHVDRDGFEALRSHVVLVDSNLLLQALNNLLDNAAKYSSSGTTITIHGGLTHKGRFHISVLNKGIPITVSEIRLSRSRGWRSRRATEVTGEGSGIGLWMVDNIMMAHEGELLVIPTTQEGWTEVKLLFPAAPVK